MKITKGDECKETQHSLIKVETVKIDDIVITYRLSITIDGKTFYRASRLSKNGLSPIRYWLESHNISILFEEVENALLSMRFALGELGEPDQ